MPLEFIKTRIHLSIIQRLRSLSNRFEQKRLRVQRGIYTQNIQHDPRCGTVIPTSNDIAIANDKDELPFIVVIQSSERVDRAAERVLAFSVTRHLAEYEFVLQFGLAFGAKLESSQD